MIQDPLTGRIQDPDSLTFVPQPSTSFGEPTPQEEERKDPREVLYRLYRRRWAMISTTLIVFSLGALFTLTRHKIYESTTKLVVVTQQGSHGGAGGSGGGADDIMNNLQSLTQSRNVDTQVEIINSPDLLDTAFKNLRHFNPLDPSTPGSPVTNAERLAGFGVTVKASEPPELPEWASKIDSKKDTDVITVTAYARTPKLAADLSNQIVETYLQQDLARNSSSMVQARDGIRKEMRTTQTDLKEAALRLSQFQKAHKLIDPESQMADFADKLADLQSTVDSTKAELAASQRQKQAAEAAVQRASPTVPFSQTVEENPSYVQVRTEIVTLQNEIDEARQEFSPTSTKIRELQKQLDAQQRRLRELSKTLITQSIQQRNPGLDQLIEDYSTATAQDVANAERLRSLTETLGDRTQKLATYPEQMRKLAELQERVTILDHTYNLLSDRYYSLGIEVQSSLPNGVVASHGRRAVRPTSPQVMRNLIISLLLGLLLAYGVAATIDRFDTRLHEPQEIERLSGLPILSAVPKTIADENNKTNSLTIGGVDNNHAFTEAFRLLRNNITFSSPDKDVKIVAITSASKGDGKSTIAINLGIAMAMDGKKVVLVDCDLRRPSVHTWLGVGRATGFTTVVKGLATIQDTVVDSPFENLQCLVAGPLAPDPTEFLNSRHSRQTIEELSRLYDVVILDCPPTTGMSDVQVISTMVDGVLLVVSVDATDRNFLMATSRLLRQANAPMFGTVLNRVDMRRSSYGYYSYYYYYGSDEGDQKSKRKRRKPTSKNV